MVYTRGVLKKFTVSLFHGYRSVIVRGGADDEINGLTCASEEGCMWVVL